jgi:hypothetical protein
MLTIKNLNKETEKVIVRLAVKSGATVETSIDEDLIKEMKIKGNFEPESAKKLNKMLNEVKRSYLDAGKKTKVK